MAAVLLIDDDESVRQACAEALRGAGLEVHDEEALFALDLLGVGALGLEPGHDGALVIAEVDGHLHELVRLRHVLDSHDGPDADVESQERVACHDRLDGRGIHVWLRAPRVASPRTLSSGLRGR